MFIDYDYLERSIYKLSRWLCNSMLTSKIPHASLSLFAEPPISTSFSCHDIINPTSRQYNKQPPISFNYPSIETHSSYQYLSYKHISNPIQAQKMEPISCMVISSSLIVGMIILQFIGEPRQAWTDEYVYVGRK